MRILHVINNLKRGNGTIEFIMNYNRSISKDPNIKFDFLIFAKESNSFECEINDLGGNIYHVDLPLSSYLNWQNIIYDFLVSENYFPDIIQVHDLVYLNTVAKYRDKIDEYIPIIGHAHSTRLSNTMIKKFRNSILTYGMLRNTDYFWGCSFEAIKTWYPNAKTNLEVIPNAIDCDLVNQVIKNVDGSVWSDNKLKIAHVGRFSLEKNQGFIFDVLLKLFEQNIPFEMNFIGDYSSENAKEFIKKISDSNFSESVIFSGILKTREVYQRLAYVNTFLFPSYFEGFGTALLEAQAFSIDCVASDSLPRNSDFGFVDYVKLETNEWLVRLKEIQSSLKNRTGPVFNANVMTKGYCIDKSAEYLLELYKRIGEKNEENIS